MRKSYNPQFVVENGRRVGFYFGNGSCAEHEYGIERLTEKFGVNNSKAGCEGFMISKGFENVLFATFEIDGVKRACLINTDKAMFVPRFDNEAVRNFVESHDCFNFGFYKYHGMGIPDVLAAWSSEDFGICVAGEDNIKALAELYYAFYNNDIMMFIGAMDDNQYSENSLMFAINSKLSEEEKMQMFEE